MRYFLDIVKIIVGKPQFEASMEVLRYIALFILSWMITETLKQIGLVPVSFTVHIWVFSYVLPVQAMLNAVLTIFGRYVDKLLFERSKYTTGTGSGLLPF